MNKLVQIIPTSGIRLFGQMVKKQIELKEKGKGTFYRSGPKARDRAKWSHVTYKGWINLQRTAGEVVTAEILSRSQADDEWQLLQAFIGWLDRHFNDQISAVHISYRHQG